LISTPTTEALRRPSRVILRLSTALWATNTHENENPEFAGGESFSYEPPAKNLRGVPVDSMQGAAQLAVPSCRTERSAPVERHTLWSERDR
jgi:hypothetical protein